MAHESSVHINEVPINVDDDEDEVDGCELRRSKTDVDLVKRTVHFDGAQTVGGRAGPSSRLNQIEHVELLGTVAHQFGHPEHHPDAWQNTVLRKRKKGIMPANEEEALCEIADAMADDHKLMADDIDGEFRRRNALRDLPQSLSRKKALKEQLTLRTNRKRSKVKSISWLKRHKYNTSLKWMKMKETIKAKLHDYSLWHNSLKKIEGMYGTGIGSYFKFLRRLFLLNCFVAVLVLSLLTIPQAIYNNLDDHNQSQPTTIPTVVINDDNGIEISNKETPQKLRTTASESIGFGDVEKNDNNGGNLRTLSNPPPFMGLDFITGSGWFNYTEAFYGAYTSGYIFSTQKYDMTLAYFFTITCCFIVYLIYLIRKVVIVYKDNYIDTDNDVGNYLMKVVFCGWDFNITDEKASALQHRSLYTELVELLEKCREDEVIDDFWTKVKNYIPKLFGWAVTALLLVGIYYASISILKYVVEDVDRGDSFMDNLELLVYPTIVNSILYTILTVLELLVPLEGYKNYRNVVYATLIRTTLVELMMLGVLIASWYTANSDYGDKEPCWENSLGQEIYRLLMVDFILFILISVVTCITVCIFKDKAEGSYLMKSLNKFHITQNTFHLIYNQTLMWVGFFFCPITPVIITFKLIIIFYIQKLTALRVIRPHCTPWRAAQMETVFLMLTLASLILAIISFCYILVNGEPSINCGPFKCDNCTNYITLVYDKVGHNAVSLKILDFIIQPGMVASIIGILAIAVYCMKSVASGRAELMTTLKKQLAMERHDRAFIIELTERLQKGDMTMKGHLIPVSPRSCMDREIEDSRHLTRRSSSFYTPNKVYPEQQRPTSGTYSDNSINLSSWN